MDKLIDSKFIFDIDLISDISGENRIFYVSFETKDKLRYKLTFDNVWDLRYTIENAGLERDFESGGERKSDITIVEDSSYIEAYKGSILNHVYPGFVEETTHYHIVDAIDTIVDILTTAEPTIEKSEDEKSEIDKLKQENEQLKWWKTNSENQNAMQIDAEELKQFRDWKKEREECNQKDAANFKF